jgi:hypothetical protein
MVLLNPVVFVYGGAGVVVNRTNGDKLVLLEIVNP